MWILYVALVVVWSGSVIAFPQYDEDFFEADGFAFDGPANRPFSKEHGHTTERTTTMTPTTMADVEYVACVRRCQRTPEYNPVCGTDRVDYDNPAMLQCAISCGKAVTLDYHGCCKKENASKLNG